MFDFNTFWHAHTPIISILIPALTSFLLLLLAIPPFRFQAGWQRQLL